MRKLDSQEINLIKEIIKNPRISDNQISKNTSIPLKTVNRKRKKIEQEGLLNYYAHLNTGSDGTGDFNAREMYIISFNFGITRDQILLSFQNMDENPILSKHILESHIGEKNGRVALIVVIESRQQSDIVEIFNAELMPIIEQSFGQGCIADVTNLRLNKIVRLLHNYVPIRNMKGGILREGIDNNSVFVTDTQKKKK